MRVVLVSTNIRIAPYRPACEYRAHDPQVVAQVQDEVVEDLLAADS